MSGGGREEPPDGEEPEPTPSKNSHRHFQHLRFSEAFKAQLDSVEPKRFDAMVSHAELRISQWVEIKVLPADPAAILACIKEAPAVQHLDRADTIMHV